MFLALVISYDYWQVTGRFTYWTEKPRLLCLHILRVWYIIASTLE